MNDKRFASDCNEAIKALAVSAQAKGFPRNLKGKDDDEVLAELMKTDEPLVTKDHMIARDHSKAIPDGFPGIVIVTNAPGIPQTMTVKQARKILRPVKEAFSNWHSASFRNSVLTITQVGIEVCHVIGGELVKDEYIPLDSEWVGKLSIVLAKNATIA